MKNLLHNQKQGLVQILDKITHLHQQYRAQKLGFENNLSQIIDGCISVSENFNKLVLRNKIQSLKTDSTIVNGGIDPRTHTKIERSRRLIIREVSHYIIKQLENLILEEYTNVENLLAKAEEAVGQVILSALQANVFSSNDLAQVRGLQDVSDLITQLNKEHNIKLMNQKILMTLHPIDLQMVYQEVIYKICRVNQFETLTTS